MSEEEYEEDGEDDPASDRFPLSEQHLTILTDLANELRRSLAKADAQHIRSAAAAILAIERLPEPTPGVQVELGYRTPRGSGNYGWADVVITEEEIRATIGEHFYDPGVGGDTESETVFYAAVGASHDSGSLRRWSEHAREMANHAYLYVRDESEDIDWTSDD